MHANNDTRDHFHTAIELAARWRAGEPEPTIGGQNLSRICGSVWHCTDTLPQTYCDQIAGMEQTGWPLAAGATYAQAARRLREMIARRAVHSC